MSMPQVRKYATIHISVKKHYLIFEKCISKKSKGFEHLAFLFLTKIIKINENKNIK
jgi:hypothetical protein